MPYARIVSKKTRYKVIESSSIGELETKIEKFISGKQDIVFGSFVCTNERYMQVIAYAEYKE